PCEALAVQLGVEQVEPGTESLATRATIPRPLPRAARSDLVGYACEPAALQVVHREPQPARVRHVELEGYRRLERVRERAQQVTIGDTRRRLGGGDVRAVECDEAAADLALHAEEPACRVHV